MTIEADRAGLARQVGLITGDPSPSLLGIAMHCGLDFVVLDAEQTGLTVRDCADVVQRLAGSGVEVGIRVPSLDDNTLVAFANTGVDEIVIPQVRRVEQLERAHRATRFTPIGSRMNQVSPASSYGRDYSRVPRVSVLFETAEAVERVEDFVASECFEGGWVGPTDLASDMRRTGSGDLDDAVAKVVAVLSRGGHSVGLPAASVADAGAVHARGADRCAVYWEREVASSLASLVNARGGPREHGRPRII